ncbi:flavin reductase family protein [Lishizhenia sp.]|uniref:flavin reductase family protein n=1 Tax=Lishizhenia sp. TaxID=2497594 RepID=UPI00299EA3D9|nr:flavin reductase family protein [Lishizhenia sp.]MDX1446709.1 flavin reductase family protein [Lishizhenia sp.]
MELTQYELTQLDRKYRLNLINSISGIKPANLIATKSKDGKENVAIFSSVVHLGSNPAQLGFVLRPQGNEPRDTYANILETGVYTINHIPEVLHKNAHYTSAKLARGVSEFERMNIAPVYLKNFHAPFVKESPVKLAMKHLHSIPLPNECSFIIGEIVYIDLPEEAVNELGQIDLAYNNTVGIGGLNTYYKLEKIETYPYVRTHELPEKEEF